MPYDQNINVVEVNKRAEMALYDAMPLRWRVLVDALPICQRLSTVYRYRETLGDDVAYATIIKAISR